MQSENMELHNSANKHLMLFLRDYYDDRISKFVEIKTKERNQLHIEHDLQLQPLYKISTSK